MIKGILCEFIGLAIAYAGWRFLKSQEVPPGDTSFAGPIINMHGVRILASYVVLGLGLMLMMMFGPMFFITAR